MAFSVPRNKKDSIVPITTRLQYVSQLPMAGGALLPPLINGSVESLQVVLGFVLVAHYPERWGL